MVVSDTGAKLSPKAPPDIMAPANNPGWAPRAIPAGYKTPIPMAIVPNPVPVAVANMQQAKNVIIMKKVPLIPIDAATPAIPLAKPEDLRIVAKTPANIQQTIGIMASSFAIPFMIVSAYTFLSFAKKKAMIKPLKAGTQRAPSEIDPQTKVVMMINVIKITKGKNDTHSPP